MREHEGATHPEDWSTRSEWYHLYGRPSPNATSGTSGCPTSLTCVSFLVSLLGIFACSEKYRGCDINELLSLIWPGNHLSNRTTGQFHRVLYDTRRIEIQREIQFLINVSHLHYRWFFAIIVEIVCENVRSISHIEVKAKASQSKLK